MVATSIKVPVELRDRVNREAQARGLTAAGLISTLLDEYERHWRMEAFGQAFRRADMAYFDEAREWEIVGIDGLGEQ